MNSRGGILLLGVSDSGEIKGLEPDFAAFGSKGRDAWEQAVWSGLGDSMPRAALSSITFQYTDTQGKTVAIFQVPPSRHPVYVRDGSSSKFFVRAACTTQPLDAREAHEYVRKREPLLRWWLTSLRRSDRRFLMYAAAGAAAVLVIVGTSYWTLSLALPITSPTAAAVFPGGGLVTTSKDRIVRVFPDGHTVVLAGSSTSGYAGDGGQGGSALFNYVFGVAVSRGGDLYIADGENHRIRRIDINGQVSTFAGTGKAGFAGDGGPARLAQIDYPQDVALDEQGDVYIADGDNNRVREVTPDGVIHTVAGTGITASNGDGGRATASALNSPAGLAIDPRGRLFISEGTTVRMVDETGVIHRYAGALDRKGTAVDGQLAVNALLQYPQGLAVDASGNLYIADAENNRIWRVDATSGKIGAVAGTGQRGYAGDGGSAVAAKLNFPTAVAIDPASNLYIADTDNDCVRVVNSHGLIHTLVGRSWQSSVLKWLPGQK
jgi:sugar lactone lactonase YvrE